MANCACSTFPHALQKKSKLSPPVCQRPSLCCSCVILRMFRTPHMKTCVNRLWFHRMVLMLRDTHLHHHKPVRTQTAGGYPRGSTSALTLSSVYHRLSVVSDTSELLTHLNVPSTNTVLLLLHRRLSMSPSTVKFSEWQNPPESCVKRLTCRCDSRMRSRPAVFALQTRELHTNTHAGECLSAVNEARCRRSLQANAALYEREGQSWAAVLVCLCVTSGDPALLFTLRSAKLKGRHKGDVSFAGGKKDASDRTVVDTALREAREELGIHITEDKVWGVLKPLRDVSGMMIAPVIAHAGPLEALSFQPNPSEVEEIFTLTLEHLCQPQNRGYTHFRTGDRYGYTLPVFHSPKHRVWGLTAVALEHTLRLIVPPERLLAQKSVQ